MTGIIVVLCVISLNLTFIGHYLMRICNCFENKENSDDMKGDK